MSRRARRRIVNLRIFTLVALSLIAGIACALVAAYCGAEQVILLCPVAAFACAFIIAVLARGLKGCAALIAVAGVFFAIGAFSTYAYYISYCTADVPLGQLGTLVGRVEEVGSTSSGGIYLVLRGATFEGTPLGGKVIVYLTDAAGDYCRAGYDAELLTTLGKESFFSDGGTGYRAVSGIKYYCTVYGGLDASQSFSVAPSVRNAIYDALYANLDQNTAAVIYAMLTGDSSGIADGTISAFRYGGIAHIFAVSGLHIGVIFGAMTLALKRVNRYISVPVSVAFIFFYSAVCSFTPSSVRAAVMCSVAAVLSLFQRRYDTFNAVSLAAAILLLINPMYLLDKGFILSFSAVSGIVFLKYPVQRLLKFLPRKLVSSLSVSLSAQAGSFAGLMSGFGYVSAVGIVLNVLVLPVLSAFYVVIFAATGITLVFPAFGAVLSVVCIPMEAFINAMTALGFESALLSGWNGALTYAAALLLFVGATDKINLIAPLRLADLSAALTLVVVAVVAAYVSFGGTRVTLSTGYSGCAVTLYTPQGSAVFITDGYYGVADMPDDAAAVVLVGDGEDLSSYLNLGRQYPLLYVCAGAPFTGNVSSTKIISSSRFSLCGAEVTLSPDFALIEAEGVKVAIIFTDVEYDLSDMRGADIVVYASEERQAVAVTEEDDYDLSYSGQLTYTLSDGAYSLVTAVPKG